MSPTFSERVGAKAVKAVQVNAMDRALRNQLWNALLCYLHELHSNCQVGNAQFELALEHALWTDFFKQPSDCRPHNDGLMPGPDDHFWEIVRSWYFDPKTAWYAIYDFIEYLVWFRFNEETAQYFAEAVNDALERENAGYRLINAKLAPLTNEQELQAIHESTHPLATVLSPVSLHIQQALELLSDRRNPDYRNSMKEAISAVECLCKLISAMPKATLGPALDKTAKLLNLNDQFRDGFKKIYGYTSDDHGIRHALKDEEHPEQEDARFMLVACSAFVNFITEKARKQGKLPIE
jgi:hypothetical protein